MQAVQSHLLKSKATRQRTLLTLLFLLTFVLSFSVGRYAIPPMQVVRILLSCVFPINNTWTEQMSIVVIHVRLPRIIAAALIGAALSCSGSVYQGMFKNPMTSPDVLGSSAGAGFGAALGMMISQSLGVISLSSFIFGLISVLLVLGISGRYRANPVLGLVLAGIMVGSLFNAGTSFLKLVADPNDQLPAITYWLMGSLASINMNDIWYLLPAVLLGIIPLFLLRWQLNVITLGDEEAKSLGVNVRMLRVVVITCATVMTAASVAISGLIGWVGLVIPHFARGAVGCDYKTMLPASALMGASFLLIVDNFARTIATNEIPIGILTALIGAPFFLYLILKGDRDV